MIWVAGATGEADGGTGFLDLREKRTIRKMIAPSSIISKSNRRTPRPNRAMVVGSANITFFINYDPNSAFHLLLKKNRPKVTKIINRKERKEHKDQTNSQSLKKRMLCDLCVLCG
jgi:hypothetical protein